MDVISPKGKSIVRTKTPYSKRKMTQKRKMTKSKMTKRKMTQKRNMTKKNTKKNKRRN
jgi:hypothetical protein